MIVATAGHIDHGKTLLVKTLTGVDTDRLPEEKARGISIDLGFAYLPLDDGTLIAFVDVPGHERFIRNMLAGVSGIDFALLVVAADDGIMPQTREHLHILDLLQISRGAAVITKIDRVDAVRVREVQDDVAQLVAGTRLAGAPVLPVSAVTGAGVEAVRDLLVAQAKRQTAQRAQGQNFRYAVDRVFSVAGSGTVLTGTVFNGSVAVGDRVVISPSGEEARVRGIQIHGRASQRVGAGERCALNLARIQLDQVQRGDWVLAPELHRPTRRIDARVKVLASEEHPLRHWTPVHLHLATTDVTARVAIRGGGSIAPGASANVHLVLDRAIGTLRGDRIVLRDQSATRTLGGGIVLDPFAPATRRGSEARMGELAAFECDTPEGALAMLIAAGRPIDVATFEVRYNLTRACAAALYESAGLVCIGQDARIAITRARFDSARQGVVAALEAFHRAQPQALGVDIDTLRGAHAADLDAAAFASVIRSLVDEHKVEATGAQARLRGHVATANDADERLWQKVSPAIEAAGPIAPTLPELATALKVNESVLKDFLHRKARTGEVMKVTADRFFLRAVLAGLAATAQATAKAQPDGRFTAAQYRDATGMGRTHAIEILEFLDRLGITQRLGNVRIIKKDYVPILGPAPVAQAARAKPSPAPSTEVRRPPAGGRLQSQRR